MKKKKLCDSNKDSTQDPAICKHPFKNFYSAH